MPDRILTDPNTGRQYIQGPFGQRLPVRSPSSTPAPPISPAPHCGPGTMPVFHAETGRWECVPTPSPAPVRAPVTSAPPPPEAIARPVGPTPVAYIPPVVNAPVQASGGAGGGGGCGCGGAAGKLASAQPSVILGAPTVSSSTGGGFSSPGNVVTSGTTPSWAVLALLFLLLLAAVRHG